MSPYKNRILMDMLTLIAVASILLSACGAPTPSTVSPTAVVVMPTQETVANPAPTTVVENPPTAAPEAKAEKPAVGGTLVFSINQEPVTLDAQTEPDATIPNFLGSTLVALSPDGKFVPYLAESWQASPDGLTWDFKIKKGVKFHDGAPLTAKDFVWTFSRALKLDPQASIAAGFLGPVKSTEASDDYTLRVNLNEPFFPILYNLSTPWMQPLEQAVVEKWGNDYGKHPIGVGPYIFKEWKTGEIITFQRNPDFNWGPAYAHQGPWFFDSLEFRIIPEYSTSIAGLEAGEIDYDPLLQAKDVKLIRDTGKFQIFEPLAQGLDPFVIFNVSQQPFDDVRVRQAFNLAVDRDTMIQIVTQGNAVPQYGPLSPTQHGYWPGVEQIGYHFNLDQAKSLLAEAGYKPGSDGILVKDGKPLKLVLKTVNIDRYIKTCEVLQEQLKTLGVDLQILQQEQGVNDQDLIGGNYQMIMIQSNYAEADQMYFILSTTSFNIGKVQDPVLQDLLNKTRSTTDPDQRQEWVNKAQQRIIEQAYWLLLYIPKNFLPLNTRIKGAVFAAATGDIRFDDAYITASP